jgi:hypothetical protein
MCCAIAEAYTVDEVKEIRDKAVALEHYARIALDDEQERRCAHIRLRAEKRAGQLLKTRPAPHGNQYGRSSETTLHDFGISKDQSSAWQKLADIAEPEFESALAADDAGDSSALNQILKAKSRPGNVFSPPVDTWLWGRVMEFERHGFDQSPVELMHTATSHMRDDVLRVVPRLCQWLSRLIYEERDVLDDGR